MHDLSIVYQLPPSCANRPPAATGAVIRGGRAGGGLIVRVPRVALRARVYALFLLQAVNKCLLCADALNMKARARAVLDQEEEQQEKRESRMLQHNVRISGIVLKQLKIFTQ